VKPRILIVEDEPGIADTLQYALRTDGFEPAWCATGEEALARIAAAAPALVILDVGLPDASGFEIFRRLRETSDVPVVFLTARSDEIDRVVGLELGADDYVAKPFSPRELVARIRTVLRRAGARADTHGRIEFPDLAVDRTTREVYAFGAPVELTLREFDLLEFLCRHPRQVFSRDQLMDAVWGYRSARDTGTVTVHIRRLREKLERDPSQPRRFQTVWGIGYRFVP
jgi:two-component system catabolic regulation response regulator CreB